MWMFAMCDRRAIAPSQHRILQRSPSTHARVPLIVCDAIVAPSHDRGSHIHCVITIYIWTAVENRDAIAKRAIANLKCSAFLFDRAIAHYCACKFPKRYPSDWMLRRDGTWALRSGRLLALGPSLIYIARWLKFYYIILNCQRLCIMFIYQIPRIW